MPFFPGLFGVLGASPGVPVIRKEVYIWSARGCSWLCMLTYLCFIFRATFWQWKRSRNSRRCCQCGYDLTGNVSGICPECGTPIPEEVKEISKQKTDDTTA